MKKKLPENAKLVFKGVIYDVYHWEQEMFDGSKATFERLKHKDTANVIAIVGDKIMLLEQEQPVKGKFLSLPGGKGEDGEKTVEIARREFLEETGYVAQALDFWKRFNSPISSMLWNNDFYIARNCTLQQEPELDNGEKISIKWISFEDFLMLSEDDSFRHRNLKKELFYLRLHPEEKEKLKNLLFGK